MNEKEKLVFQLLLNNLIRQHPLPWKIDTDFMGSEIYDRGRNLVIRCNSNEEAEALLEVVNKHENK